MGSSWVFRIKRHSDSSIERYKVQIVTQGCSQHPRRDYFEVHTPTPCPATIWTTFATAAAEDLESCTLLSLRWDSSKLKLIDQSISTQIAMSESLSPSTLMTLPLLAKMELPLIEQSNS